VKKYSILVFVTAAVLAIDQYTKHLAVEYLKDGRIVDVVSGYFRLLYVENPGAAWGFLSQTASSFRLPFFYIISALAILLIGYYFHKLSSNAWAMMISLSLILGGALGNLIDRIKNNFVVDFVDWYYKNNHWPTFNIADAAITAGVVLMILAILLEKKDGETEVSSNETGKARDQEG